MRYRQFGSTGLFVSELCLGTMTFGGGEGGIWGTIGRLQQDDADAHRRRARSMPASTSSTRPTSTPSGRSEEITGQALKNLGVAARRRRRRHQGVRRDGRRGRTTAAPRAATSWTAVEGEPEAAAARPHRPLPDPRLRPGDADRGDAARARHLVRHGPCPLRRRLELGGVADREGARHLRAARPGALRVAAGVLHDRRPRPRARARADAAERRARPDGLEPARRRPAERQVRARRQRREAAAAATTFDFPPVDSDRAYDCHRRDARDRARRAASRWRRSRWPGCCTSRR